MFLGVNVHKYETKADGIGPANLSHFDSEWLVGGREFDMEGQAGTGRQGFLAHHMAPLVGETRDQSASSNITTGKREWHLNFVTGTVATLHECLLLRESAGFGRGPLQDGYAVRAPKSTNRLPDGSLTGQAETATAAYHSGRLPAAYR
jgi:hypothetical protein